jgi:hypothetical protein
MWRGMFIGFMTGGIAALVMMIKDNGWRFGLGQLLALITLASVLVSIIAADAYWHPY